MFSPTNSLRQQRTNLFLGINLTIGSNITWTRVNIRSSKSSLRGKWLWWIYHRSLWWFWPEYIYIYNRASSISYQLKLKSNHVLVNKPVKSLMTSSLTPCKMEMPTRLMQKLLSLQLQWYCAYGTLEMDWRDQLIIWNIRTINI